MRFHILDDPCSDIEDCGWYPQLFITRADLINAYNKDSVKALSKINILLEMYTTPACFKTIGFSMDGLKKTYERFNNSKNIKGLIFDINEQDLKVYLKTYS